MPALSQDSLSSIRAGRCDVRYVGFGLLAAIFSLTALHFTYINMNGQQRWQAFCFTHLATASDCADRGYGRL